MNKNSRTANSIKNVGVGTFLQLFALILSFITRSIFVKLLGIEYLSVDGLFSNILTLLNFTELGIGSAIIFSLYKPIAEQDYTKIGALMNLFRTAYRYIAITILGIGILIIPLLDIIITDVPEVKESMTLLYSFFLINSVCSYVYGYKKSLLIADQKNYIVLTIYQCIHTIQILSQILILYFTHNYILFLSVMIVCTLLNNIITTLYVNRRYGWLDLKINEKLESEDKKTIFSNVKAIIFYKLGSVVLNGTNNLVISTVIKTTLVGFCANYTLIINALSTVLNQGMSGLMASIGNYNVKANPIENECVFKQLDFMLFWVMSFICVALCCFVNEFILLWLGSAYILDNIFVWVLTLSFYVLMINAIPSSFRMAMGLFQKAKFYPMIAALINLVLSVLFARWIGLIGVFIANILTRLVCYTIVDTNLIYRYGFKMSCITYYIKYIGRLLFMFVVYVFFAKILLLIESSGWIGLFAKITLFTALYNLLFVLLFWKNESFILVRRRLLTVVRK